MIRRIIDVAGYAFVALLFTVALAVAARTEGIPSEKPSQDIWQAADGTYTNLPVTHGDVKRWEPTRDRVTPVTRTARPHNWAAAVPKQEVRSAVIQSAGLDCRDVYVGGLSRAGAATVCAGETAEVREERVIRRGHTTTTTDQVLTINGREVIRVRGRSWTHDPGQTVRK